MTTRQSRIAGGLWGLLVGDALGVPYEFHFPGDLPPHQDLEMTPPKGFRRAHASVPPGTWSDDGAQALCLLASLLACGKLDLDDLGRRFVAWYDEGYMAVGGEVFDIGIQTSDALCNLRKRAPARTAGSSHEHANGNGSLMRVLPLALWHRGSDAELARDAAEQSLVTHGHLRSQVCCALYCLWARCLLDLPPDASPADAASTWADAVATIRAIYGRGSAAVAEMDHHLRPDEPPDGSGTGYVVDCLRSARLVVNHHDSYEAVVKGSVALGRDTDTTACVAGGLAGLRHGVTTIPARWLNALRGQDLVEPLLQQLLAHDDGTSATPSTAPSTSNPEA